MHIDTTPRDINVLAFAAPPVLTPHQFHAAIGRSIGLNSVYAALCSGRLRHVRGGNRHLILASEVQHYFTREAARLEEVTPWSA